MREKKNAERVCFSGVDAERAVREKGVNVANMGGGGDRYPNRYDQSSSRVSIRGKGK